MAALQTHALTRRFGRHEVLKGLDLAVPEGAVYGLIGRNGAGKTTTFQIVLGILRSNSGTVSYAGKQVRQPTSAMRASVGYVSQHNHMWPWMRVNHMGWFVGAFYPGWDGNRYHSLLERLAIDPRQRIGQLSGGTQTKLRFALALAHRPQLLLLDEPTAGVDPVTRRELLDLIADEATARGCTTLFSSHHVLELAKVASHLGVLHGGKLFYEGVTSGLEAMVRPCTELPAGTTLLHTEADGTLWATGAPELLADLEPGGLEETVVAIARST